MKPASLAQALYAALGDRRARWLGSTLSLVAILWICRVLYVERGRLSGVELDGNLLLAGLVTILVVALGNLLGSVAGWLLLRREAASISAPFVIAVNGLAQMAKYLPGNFLHLVGRFYLIKHRSDSKVAFAFSLYELLLLMLAGMALGLLYVHYVQPEVWRLSMLVMLALLAIGIGLAMLNRLAFLRAPLKDLGLVILLYLVSFLCYGLAFNMLFRLVFDLHTASVMLCAILFALAFVAGYVTPGAPGGLGVREFVFMVLAQPLFDSTLAVSAVVLFRLFSIAGDLVFALLALGVRKRYAVKLIT